MSWPRESLVLALLVLSAPWASADTITVNTRTDDNANNSLCSLREAVEYFNRGRPKTGYQGCTSPATDTASVVKLPAEDEAYLVSSSAITIRTGLTISGEGQAEDAATTVRVQGTHRAFVINFAPDYQPHRCSSATGYSCAPPGAPDLDAASDTGVVGDYLTTATNPTLTGSISSPTAGLTYVIRLYDHPGEGDPVQVGLVEVAAADTAPLPWAARVSRLLDPGVHFLSYTVQVISSATRVEVNAESGQSPHLTLSIHNDLDRISVALSDLIIEGGCEAAATSCANDVDDVVTIINNPSSSGYDERALSFSNELSDTAGNGGVIFNNELLSLSNVLIKYGRASGSGGALYLGGSAGAQIRDSELRESEAASGAAVFAAANTLVLERSLITANTVTGTGGAEAVIDVQATADPSLVSGIAPTKIINTTISANTGRALSLRDDMVVNASTVVDNSAGGLHFNGEDVEVYNSIIAGNQSADCEARPLTAVMENNLVVAAGGCATTGNQVISNAAGTIEQLMATEVDGYCTGDVGLLCPLADHGGPTFVHVPRVLIGYSQISDSPIINKASAAVGGFDARACPANDQRSKSREAYACDIGAVELQSVASGSYTRSGGAVFFGQTYTQPLGYDLGDEELLPAAQCPAPDTDPATSLPIPPVTHADPSKVVPGSYRRDVPGCPWLEVNASRGIVSFSIDGADGSYSYRPTVDFHGFDRFDIRVITTLSNLNALAADRSRLVRAQVIVEPSTGMSSSKVGGALDIWGLGGLGILGLGWIGRRRQP